MSEQHSQFAPAQLLPVPVEARLCALPYGLTWDDVAPCLPGLAGTDGATAWVSHTKQGMHGGASSAILTLRYRDSAGSRRAQTFFFKEVTAPARAEAEKYRFLSSRGVPTARLLTVVSRADSEVLILEFLPTIGIGAGEADDLLALIAQLNAVEHPPTEVFQPKQGEPQSEFDARVEAALVSLASDPSVGVRVDPPSWLTLYQNLNEAVAAMPVALNHGELYFQQVGWSASNSERQLVMFDLDTMALMPQFTDIASVLHGLSVQSGRAERELFSAYLQKLGALNGVKLDPSYAWEEMLRVRIVTSFQTLPWLVDTAGHAYMSDTPAGTALRLRNDLSYLGLLP